jgi:hypothetical protein
MRVSSLSGKAALAIGIALLSGCVPYVTKYPKIDSPDVVYFNPSCSGGPASMAYFPRNLYFD